MTFPELLQSAALIAVCFAILEICSGSDAAKWAVLVALALVAFAIIKKTDKKG